MKDDNYHQRTVFKIISQVLHLNHVEQLQGYALCVLALFLIIT